MNDKQKENITHVVIALLTAQSVLHRLDMIDDSEPGAVGFRNEKKRIFNEMIASNKRFLTRLEIDIDEFTRNLSVEESQMHSDIVTKIDEFINEITVGI